VFDVGYKSEGRNKYKHNNNSSGGGGEVIPLNHTLPHNSIPFHQCIGKTNPMYRRSGGDLTMIPSQQQQAQQQQQQQHSSFQSSYTTPRNNGYLSDGEGYAIRNRRISKSGRYGGSHGSSPGANGPTVPFGCDSNVENSRKSPYQQHGVLHQRHESRGQGGKGMMYPPCTNDRSGDDTRDDDDDEDDDDEDDGYMGDNIDERGGVVHPRRSGGAVGEPVGGAKRRFEVGGSHVVGNISITPADTDDLDDIEDDADDDEENDDDIEDERDMEDTNEDRTTASATATVVAAAVTTAALKTTKNSNGIQNETDLIVSYSTYQAQTAAIGNSTNASKLNRIKMKSNKPIPIASNQGNTIQSNNNVGGADSSCEELFAATVESTPAGVKTNPKIIRSNNSSGGSIDNEEGRGNVPKKSSRANGGGSQKNSRNSSRQGIYSSDQSSTGGGSLA
jgi:hypothetical protein